MKIERISIKRTIFTINRRNEKTEKQQHINYTNEKTKTSNEQDDDNATSQDDFYNITLQDDPDNNTFEDYDEKENNVCDD